MSLQLNTVERKIAPENEQAVCLECGLCCDGTLFGHAELGHEEKGHLPDLIEQNVFMVDGKDYFRLPCLYFRGKCTIYESQRAVVCGSYRCRLLNDIADGKASAEEAFSIVRRAREMRNSLVLDYSIFRPGHEMLPFAKILMELGKHDKSTAGNDFTEADHDIMQARCNIFEALLIRHFRPSGHFEKMVMKMDQDNEKAE